MKGIGSSTGTTVHDVQSRRCAIAAIVVALPLSVSIGHEAYATTIERTDHVPFIGSYRVTRTWGHAGTPHATPAIDFGLPCGTRVRASGAGTVTAAGTHSIAGRYVLVYHRDSRRTSIVQHLQSRAVTPGQVVYRGQTLGYSGSTGRSTGCHLHFAEFAGRRTSVPSDRDRIDPGTMYACHGSVVKAYANWPSRVGTIVRSDGSKCRS